MAIIGVLPTILTNGTTADATQVMGDFNFIVSQVNANAAAAGANSNITSILGLTTPLTTTQGGTGASSAGTALDNVGGFSLDGVPSRIGNGTYTLIELAIGFKTGRGYLAASGASVAYSAEQVLLGTGVGPSAALVSLIGFSAAASLGVQGIGGFDAGTSAPNSNFLALYAAQGSSGSGMFFCSQSTSSGAVYTGPSLPVGFSYTSLLGMWPTTASGQLVAGALVDRQFGYQVPFSFGAASAPPTLTARAVSSACPSAARYVSGVVTVVASSNGTWTVAADASGLYTQQDLLTTNATTGFAGAMSFTLLPMVSTTTIFLAEVGGSGATASVTVTAYQI